MKRGTPRHPKVYELMSALGITCRATAVGYLEMLWHFTAEFAPRGDIGRFPDAWIESALDWSGRRGRLIEALTTSRWLDVPTGSNSVHRLVVHDWSDHCEESTRRRLKRLGVWFVEDSRKLTEDLPPGDGQLPFCSSPLPTPVPLPTPRPEPTAYAAAAQPNGTLAVRPVARSQFPLTGSSIRKRFPATDDAFIDNLIAAIEQAVHSEPATATGEITDQLIAEAVEKCWQTSNGQNYAGLFIKTVPQCIKTWLTQGKDTTPPKKSGNSLADRTLAVMRDRAEKGQRPL